MLPLTLQLIQHAASTKSAEHVHTHINTVITQLDRIEANQQVIMTQLNALQQSGSGAKVP